MAEIRVYSMRVHCLNGNGLVQQQQGTVTFVAEFSTNTGYAIRDCPSCTKAGAAGPPQYTLDLGWVKCVRRAGEIDPAEPRPLSLGSCGHR